MAKARNKDVTASKAAASETPIITDTAEQEEKRAKGSAAASGSDLVYIACGMPLGIKFDDVDNGSGGVKTVSFPGINHALRGKKTGILLGDGNAVLTTISRADWESIKRKHGRERAFTSQPPLLMEMKSKQEFNARRDEVEEMKTGVAPIDPDTVGVQKA